VKRWAYVVLFLALPFCFCHGEVLNVSGKFLKGAVSAEGEVFLSYMKGDNLEHGPGDLFIFDVANQTEYQVPDGSVFRGFLLTGLAVGHGKVMVAWTPDNYKVVYREFSIANKTWGNKDLLFQANQQGVNRCSIAVNDTGVMVVSAFVWELKSRLKPHGGSWGSPQVVFPNISSSEPTYPQVYPYNATQFVCTYTCTCRTGNTATKQKSIGASIWNNSWSSATGNAWEISSPFNIEGSPFMNDMAVGKNGNLYFTWMDWCSENDGFCRIGYGQRKGGLWSEKTLLSKSGLSTTDRTPTNGVAVDNNSNVIVTYGLNSGANTSTYMRVCRNGAWQSAKLMGNKSDIVVLFSQKEGKFYLFYFSGGLILEKIDLTVPDPTPTPVVVPDTVHQWDLFERVFYTTKDYSNPFKVKLFGWFAKPGSSLPSGECDGDCFPVRGFYDGEENGKHRFVIRFRPDFKGEWSYSTFSADGNKDLRVANDTFNCVVPRVNNHGPMARQGRFIFYADGTDRYYLGGTAFGLMTGNYLSFLQEFTDKGINEFRFVNNTTWGRGDTSGSLIGCGEPGLVNGCWLNTFIFDFPPYPADQARDWTLMSIANMRKLDAILYYLLEHGGQAEIVLFDSSMKYVFGPNETSWQQGYFYTPDDPRQKPYLEYMASRFGDFPNIIWEACNELRHNASGSWQQEWQMAKDYVRWLGQYMKQLTPDVLFAYDAGWADQSWSYNPTNLQPNNAQFPGCESVWHTPLWGESWVDIVNLHTDRAGGIWWWRGAAQMQYLSDKFNKPTSNDEPARAGWGAGATEDECRKSAYLTTFVGNSYYTIHGLRNDDFCRGCISAENIGSWTPHYAKFWRKLGKFNFHPDWGLIQGNGQYKRAMHRNGTYAYYAQDAQGAFKLKTLESKKYELYVMNVKSGTVFYDEIVTKKDVDIVCNNVTDFVAFLKPYVKPTPTPTPPTPTPTPGSGNGSSGCIPNVFGATTESNADDFFAAILAGMFFIGFLFTVRKFILFRHYFK